MEKITDTNGCGGTCQVWERCREYERTGKTPEEVAQYVEAEKGARLFQVFTSLPVETARLDKAKLLLMQARAVLTGEAAPSNKCAVIERIARFLREGTEAP